MLSSNNFSITKYVVKLKDTKYLERKRILMYTNYFKHTDTKLFNNCEPINCEFTYDKKLFSMSDAVVFHFADIIPNDIPTRAFPSQKFVYFSLEAPFSTEFRFAPKNFFNWIMSYNNKSDITFEYGSKWIKNNSTHMKLNYTYDEIILKKLYKGIIGYISNCNSNSVREKYIEKLKQYIQVNVYGNCQVNPITNVTCNVTDYECEKEFINSYYFFFALENAICNNYITEKYWKRFTFDSIPIVIKRKIYTDVGIPNSSFIAIDDFNSSKEMGDYLNYLINNPLEYLKYFNYRTENITVIPQSEYDLMNGICNLCTKVRQNNDDKKIIEDVNSIYLDINNCIPKSVMYNFANNW
ncbi:Alpha-(1,3)-fucosyltransferase C [Strongyloides ratti]|uniref:Fucosyltransferase n=1 Tax=Strongyloides ratti TaxID=34506 RepID=A0A090LLS7_STRRB|nr:Alpha-(1,3)-fucosyltransferase C [Strongyloides ratti]CEF69118.1 Alpha-(1,3)-fucosyltransferase C [Strongyloides ratti]